ncbi:unannotated protein [freshwater metagenome]|uniref:Unannotated protein n=1 Tax=freshwater metagenome TaxID=449393 RepID=A0A6J7AJ58_9ZZZZ
MAAAPAPTTLRAVITTFLIPNRSMKAAANGAVNPKSKTLTETAKEIWSLPQPNASSSGTIRTEGAERNPADATRVKKVTIAAIHPGCIFVRVDTTCLPPKPRDIA